MDPSNPHPGLVSWRNGTLTASASRVLLCCASPAGPGAARPRTRGHCGRTLRVRRPVTYVAVDPHNVVRSSHTETIILPEASVALGIVTVTDSGSPVGICARGFLN